jgi:hypothetical protein
MKNMQHHATSAATSCNICVFVDTSSVLKFLNSAGGLCHESISLPHFDSRAYSQQKTDFGGRWNYCKIT